MTSVGQAGRAKVAANRARRKRLGLKSWHTRRPFERRLVKTYDGRYIWADFPVERRQAARA